MSHEELIHVLALMHIDGVGDVVAKRLISHCGTATEVFRTPPAKLRKIDGIGTILVRNLRNRAVFTRAEKEARYIVDHEIRFDEFRESNYPERLKHCADGPVVLFSRGDINLSNRKIISIVGTRQVTAYGAEVCRELVAGLAPLEPVIVSGFAYGVDICAHAAAIDHKLQTIGVLAHGLNQIYPAVHRRYMARMESNGGFITEFCSDSSPDRENFLRRNRIVAGISEATIVIESAEKGGSLVTARMANDYNRDVFAVPGRITDKYSHGCNNLIKSQQAHALTCAADVLYILNWNIEKAGRPVQKQLFITLNPDEQKIYDYLQRNGKQMLDFIAPACAFPIFRVSGLLLDLELKGAVRPLPGKLFEAI